MSDETKRAAQDAIAAHIADENEGEPLEYLTDWIVVSAAAIAEDCDRTSYWFISNDGIPYRSQLGLLHRGIEYVSS